MDMLKKSLINKLFGAASIVISLFLPSHLWASDYYDHCFEDAGRRYDIDPSLLKAIAIQESALDPVARNGVGDTGLMQINPFWFDKLADYGITPVHLEEACISANVGAWILATNFAQYGRGWNAVGVYHAGTSKAKEVKERAARYIEKIKRHYSRLNGRK